MKLARYMINLEHLATAVKYGSISNAANVLAITQPALTRSIMRLEDILEVKLLLRTARGVIPTQAGVALLEHIAATDAELERAAETIRILKGESEGRVSCGAGSVSAHHLLPAAVSAIRKRRKNVMVSLIEARTYELLPKLQSGDLDIVIGIEQFDAVSADFINEPLIYETIGFIVRAGHPVFNCEEHALRDVVASDKLVLPGLASSLGRALQAENKRLDCTLTQHRVETLSFSAIRHLVLQEDYVALASSLVFSAELQSQDVRILRGDWFFRPMTTSLYYRRSEIVPPLLGQFIAEIRLAAQKWTANQGNPHN